MFHICFAHFAIVIFLAIAKLSYANKSEIQVVQVNRNQKYCLIQVQHCDHDLHPLCKTLDKVYENQNAEHIEFLDLTTIDKSNIVDSINEFRNKLAGGHINEYKSGSNFRLVNWSSDFQELAEANYLYNSFCNKISLNNSEFVDEIELLDEKEAGPYFFRNSLNEKINESYGKTIWNALFRAEFNRIGCVWVNNTVTVVYTFFCYTNRMGPEDADFSFENAYKPGQPCTECGVGKCNVRFRNLCDDTVPENSNEFDHNLVDYKDHNDDVVDSHFILYLIIGSVIIALSIVIGLIFLCICLRKHADDCGETYNINHSRRNRGDLFADTIYVK